MTPEPPFVIRPVRTARDWADARAIRQRVFVEEQACPPELEWDEHDRPGARGGSCRHLLGLEGGRAVATARWRVVEGVGGSAAKLERFAVLPERRGGGRGRALVARALADARGLGLTRFVLHAQAHLRGFYEAFGFRQAGEPFDEAGIPHLKMTLTDPDGSPDPVA